MTRRILLDMLKFRLSEFIIALFKMNGLDILGQNQSVTRYDTIKFNPLTTLFKSIKNKNNSKLRIILESYNSSVLNRSSTLDIF